MRELLCLLTPGALTWLTAAKCTKAKNDNGASALIELLAYAGLNMGLMWVISLLRKDSVAAIASEEPVSYTGINFWLSLLVAVLLGFFIAVLKTIHLEIQIIPSVPRMFAGLNPRMRKLLAGALAAFLVVLAAGVSLAPKISEWKIASRKNNCRDTCESLLNQTRDAVAKCISDGTVPEDFEFDGVTVTRVNKDQRWNMGTGESSAEAVYMIDGNNCLVYISYRDEYYAVTWSGPSEDIDFIQSQGGWNDGKGSGWSGSALK